MLLVTHWSLDPLLVWGLFTRGLGLVLFISFLSLAQQVLWVGGKRAGIGSAARRLEQIRRDFPTWKRYFYFPTLLWFNSSDAMLQTLPIVGLIGAGAVIYGGALSPYALGLCYICYLSLDLPAGLIFPWDCFLFEGTVLALFLPATHALPQLTAAAAPAPALSWAFRWLLFRLMFGFGKQKFMGSRGKDSAYLRGFLIYQPLLSPAAWYAQKAPLWLLKAGVAFMFFVEIPAPFLAFFPGPLSVLCAAVTAMLMVGIWISGNFGYFSLATIMMCLPLLDNVTPRQLELSQLFAAGAPLFTNAFLVVHTLCSLVAFLFNSWVGQVWTLWAIWYRLPRVFQPFIHFLRLAHPFRWLHPYGVFPPNNQPGVKMGLLPEVSWDGKTWHELHFKYAPNEERSRGHFIAPHHPRGDQAVVYDTFGVNANSLMSSLLGPWDPYFFACALPAREFCQKLVEGTGFGLVDNAAARQHETPPLAARITTVMLEPISIAERKRTGRLWKRTYIGPHVPTHTYDPDFSIDAFGEPELWHPDAIAWRYRSRFKELLVRARTGREDPMQLAIWDGQLTAQDVELFWNEFVPLVGAVDRSSFDSLPRTVAAVNARFDRHQRRVLARLLGRFTLILLARLEPLYLYRGSKPLLHAQTYMHLWMVAQYILAQGKDAYLHAIAEPLSCNEQLAQLTTANGLYLLSIFRFEEMCFEAQKLRLINAVAHPHDPAKKREVAEKQRLRDTAPLTDLERKLISFGRSVSGFFCVMLDLRDSFIGPEFDRGFPELYPTFEELESGDIRVHTYAQPEPGQPLAPDLKSLPRTRSERPAAVSG